MGGFGSGRHYSSRDTTSSYLRLDIRDLQRKGFLRPVGWTRLQWSRGEDPAGSIGIRAELDHVILRYRHQRYGDEWIDKEYPIFFDCTRCNYGGTRLWFRCPAGGCARRVAVLYGGDIFACRHCRRLAYDSQRETAHSRALGRAQAIRVKLGGSPVGEFPDKPKGMHWRTYYGLCEKADEAESNSWPPWLIKMLAKKS